jgi:tetratricopeptide (TPR) repeat protein
MYPAPSMGKSPLDHPRLMAVEKKLDAGALDEAQHLLAQLGDNYFFRHATTYLASRLLYLRGTLDEDGLAERLARVLNDTDDFPEAESLLSQARSGLLARPSQAPRSSRSPPAVPSSRPPAAGAEVAFGSWRPSVDRQQLEAPTFPRAGRVPSLDARPPLTRPDSIPDLEVSGHGAPAPGFARDSRPPAKATGPKVADAGERLELTAVSRPTEARRREDKQDTGRRSETSYSEMPRAPEEIHLSRKAPARESAPAAATREARSHTEPLIGTEAPPTAPAQKSLFEIAGMLDTGHAADALAALDLRGNVDEPDHALLRARALALGGRPADALALARRLGHAPLLDPTVRAGVARLALELGDLELGLEQATRAHEEDPLKPTIRLTCAWAALRQARRTADSDLVSRASLSLRDLVGDGGPHEGLLLGLRAGIEAHAGDAERALSLAERAVELEPTADGYAALAMAAARLGRPAEVQSAVQLLRAHSPAEAAALAHSLEIHGESLFELRAQPDSIYAPAASADVEAASLWGPLELAVIDGDHPHAWETFAQLATDTLSQLSDGARREPPALAAVAASFLTVAPVSRDLAPYDQTPWSLTRVADLLALLARGARGAPIEHPLVELLGAYVGESLRLTSHAHWDGDHFDPASLTVTGPRGAWYPHVLVRDALAGRRDLNAAAAAAEAVTHEQAARPHPPAVTPMCPWDPAPWPAPSRLPHYALALRQSVIAVLCQDLTGISLDGSIGSLAALDRYVDRIAPRRAPVPADPSWARRVTVLLGAYLGEAIKGQVGGEWSKRDRLELGPPSYQLVLASGRELWPVEHVAARIGERAASLAEYARAFVR